MKRKLFHYSNLALIFGLALIIYIAYATVQHTMNWTKLVLFWIACGLVAVFLLYHLSARMPGAWPERPIRRYSLLHRAGCAVLLLLVGLAAFLFSYRTWQTWQLPGLYWEPIEARKISRERFEIVLAIGNQRYHNALYIREIQLTALSNPKPPTPAIQVTLKVDSLHLPPESDSRLSPSFVLEDELILPPLETRELALAIEAQEVLAIYQIQALYGEDKKPADNVLICDRYVLLERGEAALIDFTVLAARSRRPSYASQINFIQAVGRSRQPMALGVLLELLQVQDIRIQNAVCEALGELGDPGAAPALIDLVKQDKNPQALRALGDLRSEATLEFLIETMENEREAFLRAEATEALGRLAVPAEGEFKRAIPVLAAVLQYSANEDALVQREAMLALARISDTLAIPIILNYAKRQHSGQALRNLLDVTTILGDQWLLPLVGTWLQDWRLYNLDFDDLQLLLDYLVATRHHDMMQVLIDALQMEISAEMQAMIIHALFQLTGNDFGELQHPVFNLTTEKSNRRILDRWQKWWKQAQQDSRFQEQIKPPG